MTDLEIERELIEIRRRRQEIEFEPRKHRVAFVLMVAAVFATGAAVGGFLVNSFKSPAPIVIKGEIKLEK